MNRAVNFSRSKAELSLLENELRHCVAQNSDENWDIRSYLVLEKFVENILSKNSFEISCLDITQSGAIAAAEQLRREYPKAMLMLIADASIAPTEYLRPGIVANSLLLKPLSAKSVFKAFSELFSSLERQNDSDSGDGGESFCIEIRGEKQFISYGYIYYFEAREKKIFVNTKNSEIGFYATLDTLADSLPEQFVRCHRGFIVNRKKIKTISYSQKLIFLNNDMLVPLSRGYKNSLDSALKGGAQRLTETII